MKTEIELKYVRTERNSANYGMPQSFKGKQNRGLNESNVKLIMQSMMMYGFLGNIIFLATKAFDDAMSTYTVDGQHRLEAAKRLGIPFNYEIWELNDDTKENVTKLISRLNSTAVRWSTNNFLDAQVSNGKKDYILIDKIKKETKLTITDILNIYLGGAGSVEMAIFRSGDMKFENVKESNSLLKSVLVMRDVLPNKSFSRRAMFKVLKSVKDHEKLAKLVKSSSLVFTENETKLEKQLLSLYQSKVGALKSTVVSKLRKVA